jgi:DNA-binding MarR family transcriptional regulator
MARAAKAKSRRRPTDRLTLSGLSQFRLLSIADSLLRAASKFYGRRFGINNSELRCLAILLDEQPLTVGELSRRGQIDKAWVSRSISNLLERGLVKRKNHSTDSRMLLISLTMAGVELTKSIYPIARSRHFHLLKGLPPKETLRTIGVLEKNAAELLNQSEEG